MSGTFITFEGIDGAGKSTQVDLLEAWLDERGYEVVVTAEPGGTALGRTLRDLLLRRDGAPIATRAEALLYAADRAQHADEVIRPALERGAVVLCDRYTDSSVAYQGAGRELSSDEIRSLSEWATDALRPDATIVIDLPVDVAAARLRAAGAKPDRLEGEGKDFHERVRGQFRAIAAADPDHVALLDGQASELSVHEGVIRVVTSVL